MTDGLYMRVWSVVRGGAAVERSRLYLVRSGRALDLRDAAWQDLAWWAGQPGEWVCVGPGRLGGTERVMALLAGERLVKQLGNSLRDPEAVARAREVARVVQDG